MKKVILCAVIALSFTITASAQTTTKQPVVTTMEIPLGPTIAYLKEPPSGIYPVFVPCFFYLTGSNGQTVEVRANAQKIHTRSNEGDWLRGVDQNTGLYIEPKQIAVIVQIKQAVDAEGRPLKNADGSPRRIYDITF